MVKTHIFTAFSIFALLFIAHPISAAPLLIQQEARKEMRGEGQEMVQTMVASLAGVKARIQTRAVLIRATVTAKGTDSLTVKGEDGKEYVVKVDGLTQWRRKFWGKSDFGETSVNDILNIYGKWNNEEMTEIQAKLIRNISIQKRHGVFFGTVKSLTSTGWIMSTAKRGDQSVTVTGARLVNRKEVWISQSDIVIGHRVRVKGLWDSKNNTMTEVTQVKDFSLPAQPTPTPK